METNSTQYITIGHEKYPVLDCEIEQIKLHFWPDNPRVYSILNGNGSKPDQYLIEKTMCSTEHVKELKESIRKNGGLMEPILVRGGDFMVLEGNSRLAAYRILAQSDPIKWGKIRARVLPDNIPDTAAFTLIGQYHIVGRKDWSPFEQAGYLYRIMANSDKAVKDISDELSIPLSNVNKLIRTYSYMQRHNDNNPEKWSHYEELSKNRGIQKAFSENPKLEAEIIRQIKNNEITMAIDLRKLGKIAQVDGKKAHRVLNDIASGEETIYTGYTIIEDAGKLDDTYQTCIKFRRKISENDFIDRILNEENPKQTRFELSKIEKIIRRLVERIDEKY